MTSICHTLGSLSSALDKRSSPKLPVEEPESAKTIGKGKQKAIPEAHTSPLSELPFSPETSKGHLWPSTLPTSPHLKKASWRHLNSIPNSAEGSAVAGGSGQNHQVDHKTFNDTRELPKPLSLQEHQLETNMSRQLLKEGNTKDDCARVTKATKQSKKLSNVRSQKASRVMNCHRSTNQGLRDVTEPLIKLRKEETTFRRTQKLVCASEQLDNITLEKPKMAYLDLKKPPETETGATVSTPDMMPFTEYEGAQTEAIGSHSREHPLEESPHKTTTQVDYDCNLQRDNKGAVKCNGTSENHKEKHYPMTVMTMGSQLPVTDSHYLWNDYYIETPQILP
jgi:hypothetical protein